jgi:protease I
MSEPRVACLLGQGFEDSEFRIPYDRVRVAGFSVDIVSPTAGEELAGYKGKEKVKSNRSIADARVDEYAALLIPGGQSPDHLRADRRFVEFVRAFDATGRPLAAVCHGPQLLISAGLVKGRTLTAWTTIQDDLRQIGADVRDQQVVTDRNWITSRKPDDLPAFSAALVQALQASAAGHPSSAEADDDDEAPPRGQNRSAHDGPALSAGASSDRANQDATASKPSGR